MNSNNYYSPNFAAHTTQLSRIERTDAAGFVERVANNIARGKTVGARIISTLADTLRSRKLMDVRPVQVEA